MNVIGIFSTGISKIDNSLSYASLQTAQKIMKGNSNFFSNIDVKLKNINHADKLSKEWASQFNCVTENWMQANGDALLGIKMRNIITISVSISLLIVAAFGIYNILTMMIYEKIKDIAILRTTGFKEKDIKKIFLLEALIIGGIGGFAGLIFGYIISGILSFIPLQSSKFTYIQNLPINFDFKFYFYGLFFALLTTFFAGWFPAKESTRIDPVDVIRGNR